MDKFPEIDVDGEQIEGDFLQREQELMGDEFKTEQDDEVADSEEKFPEVDHHAYEPESAPVVEDNGAAEVAVAKDFSLLNLEDLEPIREWRQRRDLEIEEREKANAKKKEDIRAKAEQTIDDFYSNYNDKKEKHSKDIVDEETKFVEKRDAFLSRGTLWDRVDELVKEVGEVPSEGRDKSRFKEVLSKLKGKDNVPGAGGYTK